MIASAIGVGVVLTLLALGLGQLFTEARRRMTFYACNECGNVTIKEPSNKRCIVCNGFGTVAQCETDGKSLRPNLDTLKPAPWDGDPEYDQRKLVD